MTTLDKVPFEQLQVGDRCRSQNKGTFGRIAQLPEAGERVTYGNGQSLLAEVDHELGRAVVIDWESGNRSIFPQLLLSRVDWLGAEQ